jgi:hypothetical protein
VRPRQTYSACVGILLVGCQAATEPKPFTGSYHLTQVNGLSLPATIYTDLQVTAGSLRLDATGDYSFIVTRRAPSVVGSASTDTLMGRWEDTGSTITLHFLSTSAVYAVATYVNPGVNVNWGGVIYMFLPDGS